MRQSQSGNQFFVCDDDDDDSDPRGSWYILGEYIPSGYKSLNMKYTLYCTGYNGYNVALEVKMGVISDSKWNEDYHGRSSNPAWISGTFDRWPLASNYHTNIKEKVTTLQQSLSVNISGMSVNRYHVFFSVNNIQHVIDLYINVNDLYLAS